MIISASRRTDIPAFYSQWFMNRIATGFVDSVNPFNRKQVTRIQLSPKDVDCIVFWTKDATPMLSHLAKLERLGYKYYFQFTVTPYGYDIEPGVHSKKEIIRAFQQLSKIIGKHRVVWRYDPIILTPKHTIAKHVADFTYLAEKLAPYTDTCIISFLDLYKKTELNTAKLHLQVLTVQAIQQLASNISPIARQHGLNIQSCSEEINLATYGIQHGACIDLKHVAMAMGCDINLHKDNTQRSACGCAKSIDIGQYNTCLHLCRYCYANFNTNMTKALYKQHDPTASVLTGHLLGDEKITDCRLKPVTRLAFNKQITLF